MNLLKKKRHPMANAAPPVDSSPCLPAGYDDERSSQYVPEQLRPYWPSQSAQADAWTTLHAPAHASELDHDTQLTRAVHDLATWCVLRDRHATNVGALEIHKRVNRAWNNPEQRPSWIDVKQRAGTLREQDKLDYLHQEYLSSATRRLRQAERGAQARAAAEARTTCTVCGQRDTRTSRRIVDHATGILVPGTGVYPQMCQPCAQVATAIIIERARAERINGTTRAELVADFLARHDGTR